MNALALFPHDAPTAPVEPTDAELDAYAAWYTLAPWAPDLDDPAKLACAVVDRVVDDLADRRKITRAHHAAAQVWLQNYRYAACDLGWCAAALDTAPSVLRLEIRRRVAEREAEKAAHADDTRRRRAPSVRLIPDRSSWAGHAMFAALVSAVTGGEWIVEDSP